ncbi:MAG: ADP-ribosylglycohydrolase family protein, partial [Oscillospiraceae bacterium]|nr:ADP-ribosylglycohydrolase family protein [Oscillospiraceae bacterium]
VAVGDALGAPLEFMSADAIQKQHGRVTEMISGGWLNVEPGEVTDDTQMTMAVARGIVEDPEDPVHAIGQNFIEWFESGPKDVGGTCAAAIAEAMSRNAETEEEWKLVGAHVNLIMIGRTGGNGALMRTIYPAVYYAARHQRHKMTRGIAKMTHAASESTEICEIYADAVHAAVFGGHPICSIPARYYKPGAEPTGYVVNTWSNVIEAILSTETFEEAVIEAVNRGGDADTIGAIAGGLAGAYYGYTSIPDRWLDALDPNLRNELDKLAEIAYKANEDYYRGLYGDLI